MAWSCKPITRQLALAECCHCYRCTVSNTREDGVVQGLLGILSHFRCQVTAKFFRSIGLKDFFGFIEVKLSGVGLCGRRLFRSGGCFSP